RCGLSRRELAARTAAHDQYGQRDRTDGQSRGSRDQPAPDRRPRGSLALGVHYLPPGTPNAVRARLGQSGWDLPERADFLICHWVPPVANAARIFVRARCRADWTEPSGMLRATAISAYSSSAIA